MKCHKCDKTMQYIKEMNFDKYKIDGWKCTCGEIYYDSEQAQEVLLTNRLKKERIKTKLGKIRSNLIIRVPKDIENALGLEKGSDVLIKIESRSLRITPI